MNTKMFAVMAVAILAVTSGAFLVMDSESSDAAVINYPLVVGEYKETIFFMMGNGTMDEGYAEDVVVVGSVPGMTISMVPRGTLANGSPYYNYVLIGIPTTVGVFDITVSAMLFGIMGSFPFENTYRFTVAAPQIVDITSTQSNTSIVAGSSFSYTVGVDPSTATISVSGASWLSVSGKVISGTAMTPGTYTVVVTASQSGYTSDTQTFVITVVPKLSFTSSCSAGGIIVV